MTCPFLEDANGIIDRVVFNEQDNSASELCRLVQALDIAQYVWQLFARVSSSQADDYRDSILPSLLYCCFRTMDGLASRS